MYWSYVNKIFLVISNGNRTEWSPIRATFTIRFLISEFARKTRRSQSVIALLTNMRTLKFKSRLHNCVFAAVNRNYEHKQQTLKHRNTQNGSKSTNHKSQTMTF